MEKQWKSVDALGRILRSYHNANAAVCRRRLGAEAAN